MTHPIEESLAKAKPYQRLSSSRGSAALAWAVADLTLALAHADRSARELMSASGLVEPNTSGDNRVSNSEFSNASLLPPYGSDAASSPTRAETHASVAEAAERVSGRRGERRIGRARLVHRRSDRRRLTRHTTDTEEKAFVSKQAALLSQPLGRAVCARARAGASRATDVAVGAQRAFSRAKSEKGAPCLTATEIGLARDAGAGARAAAAMRAVLTTRDHAKQTGARRDVLGVDAVRARAGREGKEGEKDFRRRISERRDE